MDGYLPKVKSLRHNAVSVDDLAFPRGLWKLHLPMELHDVANALYHLMGQKQGLISACDVLG